MSMRCINCGIAVIRLRRHLVSSLSLNSQVKLARWLNNIKELPSDNYICHNCVLLVNSEADERLMGHNTVCVACGKSVQRSRHLKLNLESPMLGVLLTQNIYDMLPPNNPVQLCSVCWMRGSRRLNRVAAQEIQVLPQDKNEGIPEAEVAADMPQRLPSVQNDVDEAECRACLKINKREKLKYVFELTDENETTDTIAEVLLRLTQVQVSVTDPYSNFICLPCYGELLNALNFISKVQTSQQILNERLNIDERPEQDNIVVVENADIKQEVLSEDETSNLNSLTAIKTAVSNIAQLANNSEESCEEEKNNEPSLKIEIDDSEEQISIENSHFSPSAANENYFIVRKQQRENIQSNSFSAKIRIRKDLSNTEITAINQHSFKSMSKSNEQDAIDKQCSFCDEVFSTVTDLMVHRACNSKYECHECECEFESYEQLAEHSTLCSHVLAKKQRLVDKRLYNESTNSKENRR